MGLMLLSIGSEWILTGLHFRLAKTNIMRTFCPPTGLMSRKKSSEICFCLRP